MMLFKYFVAAVLLFSHTLLIAQSEQTLTLLDSENSLPITGATFQYGDQSGISDDNGKIYFNWSQDQTMELSHIKYGTWSWTDSDLQELIKKEFVFKNSITVNLYPVTIIAVKPQGQSPATDITINYQQRMEHDAASILNQSPAFNSIQKAGNYGFDPVFRGFKYDQLNIVMNGAQSATAACPNRMDPPTSQMAPNMVDRIEVLKGPHALRYGTGFGATINFIPTGLRFTSENKVYGRISGGYEGNGDIKRGETQLGFSGDRYDLSIFGSWSQGSDYETGDNETIDAGFNRSSFGVNLGLKISENQQLRLSSTYNRARDADFPALLMDLRDDDTWMFNARHDIQLNSGALESWNTTIFGSFVDHLMDNLLKNLDPRMLNASTAATTYNYGGRTEGIWNLKSGRLYAGADLRVEGAEGIRTREFLMGPNAGNTVTDNAWQEGQISKTGTFAEYHINSGNTNFVISGRLEVNSADVNNPSTEFTAVHSSTEVTQINPNLSVGINKKIGNKGRASVWLGRAQRSGSLTERFINYFPVGQDPFEMLGNPDLDPEKNNQIDLTYEWKKNSTSFQVDIFAAYLRDFITSAIDSTLSPRLPMSPGVRSFINIDEAFKAGFEVNLQSDLPLGFRQNLAVAYTYGEDLIREEALPEIAPLDLRYSLSKTLFSDKLQALVTFRHVQEQGRISTEFGETITPSFNLVDIEVQYRVTEKLQINLGANNLFDTNYYEHLTRSVRGAMNPIFAPGRNVYTNLSYTF